MSRKRPAQSLLSRFFARKHAAPGVVPPPLAAPGAEDGSDEDASDARGEGTVPPVASVTTSHSSAGNESDARASIERALHVSDAQRARALAALMSAEEAARPDEDGGMADYGPSQAANAPTKPTPLEKQVVELKQQHPGVLVRARLHRAAAAAASALTRVRRPAHGGGRLQASLLWRRRDGRVQGGVRAP